MFIRRLPKFEYHSPATMGEALAAMSAHGGNCKVIAGGTDLLVSMKKRETVPEHLINLKGIAGMKGIRDEGAEGVHIGALTTIGDIERSEVIREKCGILYDAVKVMAAPQVRNLGTIGGNLCSAVPAADTAPPLIALGASVKLVGPDHERLVLVEGFFNGPRESALESSEILTEIIIPPVPENSAGAYMKLMRRNALDLALVGVGAQIKLDESGQCLEARIALGAVAPTPLRAVKAEAVLVRKKIDEALAAEAGEVASREASPISDLRATKEYRTEMITVLTKRALVTACDRVCGE